MKRRPSKGQQQHERWRRQRARAPKYKPNDHWMREYEEAIVMADILRHPADWLGTADLRMQAPMRYSIKLKSVLLRMARPGGPLECKSGTRGWCGASFRIRTNTVSKAA